MYLVLVPYRVTVETYGGTLVQATGNRRIIILAGSIYRGILSPADSSRLRALEVLEQGAGLTALRALVAS